MSTLVGEHAEPQAQDDRDVSLADTSTGLGAEQAVAFFLQALERRWDDGWNRVALAENRFGSSV